MADGTFDNRVKEDKRGLFGRFLRQHGDAVYAFALSLSRDPERAFELTAEAYRRAWKGFAAFDGRRSFRSWVWKILQNVYLNALRDERRRGILSLDAEGPGGAQRLGETLPELEPGPAEEALRDEKRRAVRRALRRLPVLFRAPLVMKELLEMDYAQIAAALQVPMGTVRSRIFRAKRMLAEALGPYAEAGRRP